MIELIQVHEPIGLNLCDINTLNPKGVKATHYTESYTTEDGKKHPYETDTNIKFGKLWYKCRDSVNVVFRNPDKDLKERKITFGEYAERKGWKDGGYIAPPTKSVIPHVPLSRLEIPEQPKADLFDRVIIPVVEFCIDFKNGMDKIFEKRYRGKQP